MTSRWFHWHKLTLQLSYRLSAKGSALLTCGVLDWMKKGWASVADLPGCLPVESVIGWRKDGLQWLIYLVAYLWSPWLDEERMGFRGWFTWLLTCGVCDWMKKGWASVADLPGCLPVESVIGWRKDGLQWLIYLVAYLWSLWLDEERMGFSGWFTWLFTCGVRDWMKKGWASVTDLPGCLPVEYVIGWRKDGLQRLIYLVAYLWSQWLDEERMGFSGWFTWLLTCGVHDWMKKGWASVADLPGWCHYFEFTLVLWHVGW